MMQCKKKHKHKKTNIVMYLDKIVQIVLKVFHYLLVEKMGYYTTATNNNAIQKMTL